LPNHHIFGWYVTHSNNTQQHPATHINTQHQQFHPEIENESTKRKKERGRSRDRESERERERERESARERANFCVRERKIGKLGGGKREREKK